MHVNVVSLTLLLSAKSKVCLEKKSCLKNVCNHFLLLVHLTITICNIYSYGIVAS